MSAVTVAPGVAINLETFEAVQVVNRTDKYAEPHVSIRFPKYDVEIDPEYTHEEITAAINGGCYYRKEWTDEVGEIDVCVLHRQNSQYSGEINPYRHCLFVAPYVECTFPGMIKINHAPSVEHSWEYMAKKAEEKFKEESGEKPYFYPGDLNASPKLSPVAEYLASGDHSSDHSATSVGVTYEDFRRPWWKRLFGIY